MNQNHIMIPVMDSFGLKNFIFDVSTHRIKKYSIVQRQMRNSAL